ncbi:MAG: indolepyruvate ferredoxin oxidoreductase family protein [Gammaproteobacteria bacterium]|nr:indolepyruvate ferredoxin oxidoreductase family protein [Gammaproteobacteria bacterium]
MNSILKNVRIDDKYTVEDGRIFVTGIQALVRLPMLQHQRDLAAGHRTAGYITGYRGSPLGSFDQQLQRAREYLDAHDITFSPAVNEDLAATALWGAQQAELDGEGRFDGVFGMWYGKGPGVDRSGDALRHANLAGTSPLGGVLVLTGDDHTCESSTTCNQSEPAMMDAMIPVLNPAGVQDILDYGLYGWALSRYSGCWVALKCVHDTVEATASIDISPGRVDIVVPEDFEVPEGGLNIRWPDTPQEQERRLHQHKHLAVQAFVRANGLDRLVHDPERASFGIMTTGKSYLDVRQALFELGIDACEAQRLGIRLYKVAMPYPLEPSGVRRFCRGLERVVVVEEKRGLMEEQLKSILFNDVEKPRVAGKRDFDGSSLFPSAGRLESNHIARALGRHILDQQPDAELEKRLQRFIERLETAPSGSVAPMIRTPYFCAGCPHNTSTVVPEGSKALAGIGCHYMAQWMDRDTARFTHMGGEGASWVGQAPFSTRSHMFQNIGDGTYYHSGLLAVRAAVAAGTNITFKILYNDAVAMTGGQPMDGPLTPEQVTWQVHGEGAARITLVSDDPGKFRKEDLAPGVTVHHRDELNDVQKDLREIPGTTVIVYEQTCAAEKRRRRKRGTFPDPAKRVFIYDRVCEGCGDCGVQSNCVAILPKDTAFGRKREIDQSACNKDFSCLKGFCPSFVTVYGGTPKKGISDTGTIDDAVGGLPDPGLADIEGTYGIVLTGVGGTGVVTIGALLGMAAHVSGKGCSVLDMMGLAQKGGAVMSHIILADDPADVSTTHIPEGGADLILGCDMMVAASPGAAARARPGATWAVVNDFEMMTGDFTHDRDKQYPADELKSVIRAHTGADNALFVNATTLATRLLGNSIGANMFILGCAYQSGRLPLHHDAIHRALELNGQAVDMNKRAFALGRLYAIDPDRVQRLAYPGAAPARRTPETLDEITAHRAEHLRAYQNEDYARRYREAVARLRDVENERAKGFVGLALGAARNLHAVMAYKDEYEVGRLYSSPDFRNQLAETFEGDYRIEFNLAPPILSRPDPRTGRPRKIRFGSWMGGIFWLVGRLRGLRGTPLDVFGYSRERRMERAMIEDYFDDIELVVRYLDAGNHATAVDLLRWPESVRGFGDIKLAALREAREHRQTLRSALQSPDRDRRAA